MPLYDLLIQYFSEVEIVGHAITKSVYRIPFSLLNLISLLFYSPNFNSKFPAFVKFLIRLKENLWLKSLQFGLPARCDRLIAICRK